MLNIIQGPSAGSPKFPADMEPPLLSENGPNSFSSNKILSVNVLQNIALKFNVWVSLKRGGSSSVIVQCTLKEDSSYS